MDESFIRERITQIRLRKGVSEYQMSYDLGHSRGYVYNISSGKALPPLKEFLAICDYFELTPQQFFDEDTKNPELIQKAISGMKQLSEDDLLILLSLINRLSKGEMMYYETLCQRKKRKRQGLASFCSFIVHLS